MELLIDDPACEQDFQKILIKIRLLKNGETVELMKKRGLAYKMNWGVSVIQLKSLAGQFKPNHILALKLWNKQWRETMILAAMLDRPDQVSEEQMDYWTKSLESVEIAEILSTYLWVNTKFAYVKALEWCRGKKHLVRFSGLHLMGRLALVGKTEMDEFFEPFFDVLAPLAKDAQLKQVFYRSYVLLGSKSNLMNKRAIAFAEMLRESDSLVAKSQADTLLSELKSDYIQHSFVKNA